MLLVLLDEAADAHLCPRRESVSQWVSEWVSEWEAKAAATTLSLFRAMRSAPTNQFTLCKNNRALLILI